MGKVKITDLMQADQETMQALSDLPEDTSFDLVKRLIYGSNYRINGGNVVATNPVSGLCKLQVGDFVALDGKFFTIANEATLNILTGVEDQDANIWGNGQTSHPTDPRKDIVCINFAYKEGSSQTKHFINPTTIPPTEYDQVVKTRIERYYTIAVVHGTPSSTPAEPATPSGYMKLATIYVGAGVTTITPGVISPNTIINIPRVDQFMKANAPISAGTDLLHSDGVFKGFLGELNVTENTPQDMSVVVADGRLLVDGYLANFITANTLAIDVASFVDIVDEPINFSGSDTQQLQEDSTPPHQVRGSGIDVTDVTGTVHYTVDYDNPGTALQINITTATGQITRIDTVNVPDAVLVDYRYYLPRYDIVQVNYITSLISVKKGIANHTPAVPSVDSDNFKLADVFVGEAVITIIQANITDQRVFIIDLDEVVTARGNRTSLWARLNNSLNADGSLAEVQETPGGAVGGGNQIFTISFAPQNNKIKLYRDGLRLVPATEYIVSGTQITILVAPSVGSVLFCEYIPVS